MTPAQELKALLALADTAWADEAGPAMLGDAGQERSKEAVAEMRRRLREAKRSTGAGLFGELMRKHALTQKEGLILLMLLKRRITGADPYLSGQRILSRINLASYEILRDQRLLASEGRLRSVQVLAPRDEYADPEDLLRMDFALSDWAFRAFSRIAERKQRLRKPAVRPYRRNEDLLLDYLRLLGMLQKRTNTLFDSEDWDEGPPASDVPGRHVQLQIDTHQSHMLARLAASDNRERLAPARFNVKYRLQPSEIQAVMTLLFREIFHGDAVMPVVELIRLVSGSRRDYLRNLGLFDAEGSLVREGIVALENRDEGHPYTADVSLEPWVVPMIVNATKLDSGFPSADWERFRKYLRELKDSEKFFRDLDRPGP